MGSDVEAHGMILPGALRDCAWQGCSTRTGRSRADVIGFTAVDAGRGWLIFELPPTELAVHPAEQNGQHELYLLCTDVNQEMSRQQAKGVICSQVHDERWGSLTKILLPGGGEIGLYQPKHPMAITFAPE